MRLETGKNPAEQEKRNEKRNAIISDENDQECCTKSRFERYKFLNLFVTDLLFNI